MNLEELAARCEYSATGQNTGPWRADLTEAAAVLRQCEEVLRDVLDGLAVEYVGTENP